MVQGTSTCIKYLLFVFNFVFVICGLALIVIGANVTRKEFTEFLNTKYLTAPVILIVVGCVIFLVAFFGCCGAVRENHCMVMTFGLLVFIIFVIELAGGISAYMYKGEVKTFLKEGMNSSLSQHKQDAVKIWDEIQIDWECCGVDGYMDYTYNNLDVPKSCCSNRTVETCKQDEIYTKGCFPQMLEKVKSAITIIGGVAVGIAVVELLGCMFAWCLASAIKRDYEGV